MAFKRLAFISILLSVASPILFRLTDISIIILLSVLLAFFTGLLSSRKNASSPLSIFSLVFSGALMGITFYLLTGNIFISLALFISSVENNIKLSFLKFNYNKWLWIEPSLATIAITFYITGNIQTHSGILFWIAEGIPVALMAFIAYSNLYGRSVTGKTSKKIIAPGQKAPLFTLPDENGNSVSLESYRGKNVLLIFVRGDWCPGCHIMMRTYEKNREILKEKDITLLCIGPDPVGVNKKMAEKIGVNYHILSDEGQKVVIQYTVELQPPLPNIPKSYKGIPLPASFLIDKEGFIRHTSRVDHVGEVLSPDDIFITLEKLGK